MTQPKNINDHDSKTDTNEPTKSGITFHPSEEGFEIDFYICNECGCRSPADAVFTCYYPEPDEFFDINGGVYERITFGITFHRGEEGTETHYFACNDCGYTCPATDDL